MDELPEPSAGERLLLDVVEDHRAGRTGGRIVVIDDADGGLSLAVARRMQPDRLVAHCDRLSQERAVRAVGPALGSALGSGTSTEAATGAPTGFTFEVSPTLDADVLAGADAVVFPLPPSLAALDELADLAARAATRVSMFGLGSAPHLNRSMNDVLGHSFHEVRASRGRGKHRVLVASRARDQLGPARYPRSTRHADLGLTLCAHGGVFGGSRIDRGTRLLLDTADQWPAGRTIDLGCGTGVLAMTAARDPRRTVLALDESATACASARTSAEVNGMGEVVDVRREDGLGERPAASADLIVCNPPFHVGTGKDSTAALAMIDGAARVLAPGGELWLVFNSHLPYRPALRRLGWTDVVRQDRNFMITRTRLGR